LGIRSAADTAHAAYLGAIYGVAPEVSAIAGRVIGERDAWNGLQQLAEAALGYFTAEERKEIGLKSIKVYNYPAPTSTTRVAENKRKELEGLQHKLTLLVDKRNVEKLLPLSREDSRLHETFDPRCLGALPRRENNFRTYSNEEHEALLQISLRVFKKYAFNKENVIERCHSHFSLDGHSIFSCNHMITSRHNESTTAAGNGLREVGLHGEVYTNQAKRFSIPAPDGGTNLEPGDVVMTDSDGLGVQLQVDFRISDCEAAIHRDLKVDEMYKKAWDEKISKYFVACKLAHVDFSPFVMSQFGKVSPRSLGLLHKWIGLDEEKDKDKDKDKSERMFMSIEEKRRWKIRENILVDLACICTRYAARSILSHRIKK
jgi:hypothetical protein